MDWRYADHPQHENIRVLMVRDNQGDSIGALVIFIDQGIPHVFRHLGKVINAFYKLHVLRCDFSFVHAQPFYLVSDNAAY